MAENKSHWYDGRIYDLFIAPNQDRMFGRIKELIEPDKKILDVGCGTGRFSFFIADKCSSITGIDLSKKNIDTANKNLANNINNKIFFNHKSTSELIAEGKEHFDYAVITYVIHEVNEDERIGLLNEMAKLADKIIIGDYNVPQPSGVWKWLNEAVEFGAGKEHYRNYKLYQKAGGILGLVKKANFKVVKEIKNKPTSAHIVMIEKINN